MKKYRSIILFALLILLAARVLIPQLDSFVDSLHALQDADPAWIFLGILAYFSGIFILAVQFTALSFKQLVFNLTLRVQAATMFVNKILPNGVGTISLNAFYLSKKDHTPSQTTTVLTVNSITSLISYTSIIIVSLLVSPIDLSILSSADIPIEAILFVLLLTVGAVFALWRVGSIRTKVRQGWHALTTEMATYKSRPRSIVIALIFNALGTSANVITIVFAAHAIGIDLPFSSALLAYTFGNIAAALIPTPGGIGSSEAGIYSGLLLVGVDSTDAMTITLLFRLISYWLPILPGYYFFWGLKKDLLADYSIKGNKSSR